MDINKKTLEYLADLGKIRLDPKKEEKLLSDLKNILNYFEELKEINTDGVNPLSGGNMGFNSFRKDEFLEDKNNKEVKEKLIEALPKEDGGYLKIPPVFE
jgi:aspartyl-tRNA(Asn)/glutamyl-tRNA(Gln) amidotransferase subunit C